MDQIRTFRDIIAWQRGMALAKAVYQNASSIPPRERYGLCDQILRAAVSVPANIAEGYGRGTPADFLRFLRVARGSLYELSTHLELAGDVGLLVPADTTTGLADETDRVLQGLIRSLEAKADQPPRRQ
ncbi:MAG: four helix bundle protein [Phycisphaerales bacterium]